MTDAPNADSVRDEALRRWLADGWLEQDFDAKGALYVYRAAYERAAQNDGSGAP